MKASLWMILLLLLSIPVLAEESSSDTAPTIATSIVKLEGSLKVTSKAVKKLETSGKKIQNLRQSKARYEPSKGKEKKASLIDQDIAAEQEQLLKLSLGLSEVRKQTLEDLEELQAAQKEKEKNSFWNRFSVGAGILASKKVPAEKKVVSDFVQNSADETHDKISFNDQRITPSTFAVADFKMTEGISLVVLANPVAVAAKGVGLTELGLGLGFPLGLTRDYILSVGKYFQNDVQLVPVGQKSDVLVNKGTLVKEKGSVESVFWTVSMTF